MEHSYPVQNGLPGHGNSYQNLRTTSLSTRSLTSRPYSENSMQHLKRQIETYYELVFMESFQNF